MAACAHGRAARWACAACAKPLCEEGCGAARWQGAVHCAPCVEAAQRGLVRRGALAAWLAPARRWGLAAAAAVLAYGACTGLDRLLFARRFDGLKPAPEFTAVDLEGRTHELSGLRGKVVVLDFWATWCPPCLRLMPDLKKLHADYKDRGLVLIGVNRDEGRGVLEKAAAEHGLDWPQVHDLAREKPLAELYGVYGLPATMIIDKQGRLFKRWQPMDRKMSYFVERLLRE